MVIGSGGSVKAAEGKHSFTHLPQTDGLKSQDVIDIVQDSQGFMWIGATNAGGLARYDGYDIKLYLSDDDDESTLSNSSLWFLFVDQADTLWAGTIRGGLNRYNADEDNFTRFLHDPEDPTSLPHDDLKSMTQTSDGTYWVGTSGGLGRFDPESGKFYNYYATPDDPASLPDNGIRAIVEDRVTGLLWLGTRRGGVSLFDPKNETFNNYAHNPDDPYSLSNNSVDAILQDDRGDWWIGTRKGLNLYDEENNQFIRYYHDPDNPDSLASNTITFLYQDSRNRLWVGTSVGLDLLDRNTNVFTHYRYDEDIQSSLGNGPVRVVYEDSVGTIWIGTQNGAVSRLSSLPDNFVIHRHDPDDPNSISHNQVISMAPAKDGGLWILMRNALNYFDGKNFTRHEHDKNNPDGLPGNLLTVLPDNLGNLWIGTRNGKLFYYNRQTQKYHSHPIPAPGGTGVVVLLAIDSENNLWFGNEGRGLIHYDGNNFTFYSPEGKDPATYDGPDYYAQAARYDAERNVLWVGAQCLLKMDLKTGAFERFYVNPDDKDHVYNRIDRIFHSNDGMLWLSSRYAIHKFDPERNQYLESVPLVDSELTGHFLAFEEPKTGYLWLRSQYSLLKYDPIEKRILNTYDIKDGLHTSYFTYMRQSKEGFAVVGGANGGIAVFDPTKIVDNPNIPPVVLTDFQVFDNSVVPGSDDGILFKAINRVSGVNLTHDQTFFTFEFSSLDYEVPEKNQYSYILEGFDDDWRFTDYKRRFASYTNVPPGEYVFRVKGSNNSGLWNEVGVNLPLAITPPVWKTKSAYILYGMLSLGAITALIAWRTSAINRRNSSLEKQLNEKKRVAEEREKLLNAVQEQAVRVEGIMNTVPAGIVLADSEHHIMSANSVALELLPTLAKVGVGEKLTSIGDVPIKKLIEAPEKGLWHEVKSQQPDGEQYYAVITREIEKNRPQSNRVIVLRDVTVERSLQEKAAAHQKMVSIGRFTAGIAHDFNNILSVIMLNAELISLTDPSVSTTRLGAIAQNASDAHNLIKQILDYSRQTIVERRTIDLIETLETQSEFLKQLLERHYNLTLHYDKSKEHFVYGDTTQIQQIMMNLVVNARDAMELGGNITINVVIMKTTDSDKPYHLLPAREWVVLSVEDEGSGIPKEILSKVFEPFFSTKPVGRGVGLGLSQIQGIVGQHDGYIDVKSVENLGTKFIIYLPRYTGAISKPPLISDSNEVKKGNGETILLVEDNAVLLETLARGMEEIGYKVIMANDGQEGLDRWRENRTQIDVVLSDVVMPNMSGVGLFRALREENAMQPVVFMTGHLIEEEAEKQFKSFLEQGLIEWVRKPIVFRDIARIVSDAIAR